MTFGQSDDLQTFQSYFSILLIVEPMQCSASDKGMNEFEDHTGSNMESRRDKDQSKSILNPSIYYCIFPPHQSQENSTARQ